MPNLFEPDTLAMLLLS